MKDTKIASRYAKSFLSFSLEKDVLESVFKDIVTLNTICGENKDFIILLRSPLVKTDKKIAIFNALFKEQFHELSLSFIHLITKKKREYLLHPIAQAFVEQYKKHKNIISAVVTTSFPIDEGYREKFTAIIQDTAKQKVDLKEVIDPDMIGGFILRVGDQEIDASVQRKLRDLKRKFINKTYEVHL